MRLFVTLLYEKHQEASKKMKMIDCVAHRILQLSQERNLSIRALALNAGVPISSVRNILNGASKNPGVVTIKKICDGLDITIVDFFNTEEFLSLEQEIE